MSRIHPDSLAARIKRYEAASNHTLPPRSPLFIRVDGKAFHTYTRHCAKPFDGALINAMVWAMRTAATEMQGFKLAYHQSDEVTFLLTDYDTHNTQPWFGGELNKILSVTASLFTAAFNRVYGHTEDALFDARAFTTPRDDAPNVFIWRQQDWERNSVQMLARAHFSHRECMNRTIPELHEMLHTHGVNWADLPPQLKNGTFLDRNGYVHHDKLDYDQVAALITPDCPVHASRESAE